MGEYDYKPAGIHHGFKRQLTDIFQLLFMLTLFAGIAWAVINIQHPEGYYTSEGTQ
jgi:hypothetical protein